MACDFYIYILYRIGGEIPFYVGKGKGPRMFKHELMSGCNPYKDNIIRKILYSGVEVPKKKIKDNLSEDQAFKLERELIKKFGRKDNGTGILANMTDGGEGAAGKIQSEENNEKQRQLAKRQWSDPDQRMKMQRAQSKAANRPDQKKRLIKQAKNWSGEKLANHIKRMTGNQINKNKPWSVARRQAYEARFKQSENDDAL